MIIKALREVCNISDNETINAENYLDGINYIDNLYKVTSILNNFVTIRSITFLPSFKGRYVCSRLGMITEPEEEEMRIIKVKSDLFFGDNDVVKKIKAAMSELCEKIELEENIFTFTLK